MANDLDGVMSNIANDIVLLAADTALIEGAEAFGDFYSGIIAAGQQDFGHNYTREESIRQRPGDIEWRIQRIAHHIRQKCFKLLE